MNLKILFCKKDFAKLKPEERFGLYPDDDWEAMHPPIFKPDVDQDGLNKLSGLITLATAKGQPGGVDVFIHVIEVDRCVPLYGKSALRIPQAAIDKLYMDCGGALVGEPVAVHPQEPPVVEEPKPPAAPVAAPFVTGTKNRR